MRLDSGWETCQAALIDELLLLPEREPDDLLDEL
jgi:hypothetical protein